MSAISAYRIGRDPSCDIVLDDASVSREHAELRVAPEGPIEFVDLGSTNGIAVRLKGKWETVVRAPVEAEEKIRVGLVIGKVSELIAAATGARFIPDDKKPAAEPATGRSFLGRLLSREHGRVVMRRDGTRPVPIEDRHEPSLHLPPIHAPGADAADASPADRPARAAMPLDAPGPDADPPARRVSPPATPLAVTPRERPSLSRAGLPLWGALPGWGKAAAIASVLAVAATVGATAYLDRRDTPAAATAPPRPTILAAAPAPGRPAVPAPPAPRADPGPPADVPPTGAKPSGPNTAVPRAAAPKPGPRVETPPAAVPPAAVPPTVAPGAPAPGAVRVAWHRLIDGPRHSHIAAAAVTAEGGLCLAGEGTLPGGGGTEGWVVRLDPQGRTLWQRRPGHPGRDGATAVLATADGGCIAAGYAADERRLWLFKLDKTGRHVWERLIPAGARGRVTAIARDRDGGFAIAAMWRPAVEAPDRAIVMRFAADGQLRFSQNYAEPGTVATDLRATSEGGLVVAGIGRARADGRPAVWLVRLARDGRVDWERTYPAPGTPNAVLLRVAREGGIVVAASYGPAPLAAAQPAPAPGPTLRLLRLDARGQAKSDERHNVGLARLIGMTAERNGLWLAGEAAAGRGETWLARFDARGRMADERRYLAGTGDRPAALVERADGRLVLAGTTGDPARRGAVVLYLDRVGRLDP
jgi:hypothetical protein